MKIYFSSYLKSILKCDGKAYFLYKDTLPLIVDKGTLLEYSIIKQNQNISFYIDEDFISNPPKNIVLTNFYGGYYIYFNFVLPCLDFKIIDELQGNNYKVTCYFDINSKISIQTNSDFYIMDIPFLNAKIEKINISNCEFIGITLECQTKLFLLFNVSNKITLILQKEIDKIITINDLVVIEKKADLAKHIISTHYSFNGKLYTAFKNIQCSKYFDRYAINERLIPYAFLEDYLVDDDYSFYLSDNVLKNKDKLRNYLGNFLGIIPPPPFRNINEIGLIKKVTDNKFYIDYFTFNINNNKIDNIIKVED